MEVIINLIIIFIIVGSVLKKFQELAKSGDKIQKPRTEQEPAYRKSRQETEIDEEQFETPVREEYNPPSYREEEVPEQKPRLEKYSRTLEEILDQMKAEMPEEESIYEAPKEIVTDIRQDSIYNAPKEIVTDIRQDSIYDAPKGIITDSREKGAYFKGKTAERFQYSAKPGAMPQFGYNAVVNGIVMSEILGRPVSMKKANEWW